MRIPIVKTKAPGNASAIKSLNTQLWDMKKLITAIGINNKHMGIIASIKRLAPKTTPEVRKQAAASKGTSFATLGIDRVAEKRNPKARGPQGGQVAGCRAFQPATNKRQAPAALVIISSAGLFLNRNQ